MIYGDSEEFYFHLHPLRDSVSPVYEQRFDFLFLYIINISEEYFLSLDKSNLFCRHLELNARNRHAGDLELNARKCDAGNWFMEITNRI